MSLEDIIDVGRIYLRPSPVTVGWIGMIHLELYDVGSAQIGLTLNLWVGMKKCRKYVEGEPNPNSSRVFS